LKSDDLLRRPEDVRAEGRSTLALRNVGGFPDGDDRIVAIRKDEVLVARFLKKAERSAKGKDGPKLG